MKYPRTIAAVAAAGAVAALAFGMSPASADAPSISTLVVTHPGNPTPVTAMTVDGNHPETGTVHVALDQYCPTAYGHGQKYGVTVTSSDTGIVTSTSASQAQLHCAEDYATIQLTGVANGGPVNVYFDPVAKAKGLQDKLAGTVVAVSVINAATTDDDNTGDDVARPAAPAVANAYLNRLGLINRCSDAYADFGNHWRGAFIKDVASWSAEMHLGKAKNDVTQYPEPTDWIKYVEGYINTEFCPLS